jgi:dienelactone hydrolase
MFKRLFLVIVIGVLILTALPANVVAQESDWLHMPTGPFQIGTVSYYWVDEARDETFTSDSDDRREIIARFWYPATVEPDAIPEPYLDNDLGWQMMVVSVGDKGQWIMPPDELVATPTHSYANAPISDAQETYPVLVFSHGWSTLAEYYTTLIEELASQGYIVVGITHPYASSPVTLQDGRVADFVPNNRMATEVSSGDQVFVLDQLEILNVDDPLGLFVGRLDLDHLGILGHSLGGVVAIRTCVAGSRCKAAINIDADSTFLGGNYFEGLDMETATVPVMFLVSGQWGQPDFDFYERLGGPAYYLTFQEIGHMNIGDFPLLLESANMPSLMTTDFDAQRSLDVINAYILAFFDRYLRGEESSLLDGPSSDFPEIEFLSRN